MAALLAEEGLLANQATLSRDLRELGLVKGPGGYAVRRNGHGILCDLRLTSVPHSGHRKSSRQVIIRAQLCVP